MIRFLKKTRISIDFFFKKVNLELFSLTFQRKIVVYYISPDFSLNSRIFNQKLINTIELFSEKDHYDTVFSFNTLKIKDFCQDLITEILDKEIDYNPKVHLVGFFDFSC